MHYYVSPTGRDNPSTTGTRTQPYATLGYALAQRGPSNIYHALPGVYGGVSIPDGMSGTEGAPTVFVSEMKWKARVVGLDEHGFDLGDNASWIVIDGFDVMGANYDGIKAYGHDNVIRNNWCHHNSFMGINVANSARTVIERNLVEFNGSNPRFHHGMYVSGAGLTIQCNVVRGNSGYGLQLCGMYGFTQGLVCNNLIYDHPNQGAMLISSEGHVGGNRVLHNTCVRNRQGLIFWSTNGSIVANNIIMVNLNSAIAPAEGSANIAADYNLCVPESPWQLHHVTGVVDPLFVLPYDQGLFWLKTGSPVIRIGDPAHTVPNDFFGLPRDPAAPDLGAFAYHLALTDVQAATANWYGGMAYGFDNGAKFQPDLWAPTGI